jgi:hypothetical protein
MYTQHTTQYRAHQLTQSAHYTPAMSALYLYIMLGATNNNVSTMHNYVSCIATSVFCVVPTFLLGVPIIKSISKITLLLVTPNHIV